MLAFSKEAEKEGFKNVARLFRAAFESETIHALNHLKVMKEINSTKENLKGALEGENYEKISMYLDFIEEVKEEGIRVLKGHLSGQLLPKSPCRPVWAGIGGRRRRR